MYGILVAVVVIRHRSCFLNRFYFMYFCLSTVCISEYKFLNVKIVYHILSLICNEPELKSEILNVPRKEKYVYVKQEVNIIQRYSKNLCLSAVIVDQCRDSPNFWQGA